jgi:hypothetical protein
VLGQGRDPLAPLQDVINDEGDIVVPVDPRYLGLWFTGLFGDPDTTDNLDGSWDHEFASGGDDLPSYTLEVGMPKVPAFFLHAGVKLNSVAPEFTRSGPAAATINAIAQGETRFGTTQGGTPTSLTFSRISQFQGSIKRAGSPVGNLTGGAVTYSNNLEKIETIRDDGLIEGADPTIAALTGRIDVRFADTTLIDLAAGGTPVDLEFAYTLSAQSKLVLTAHEVYLPKPKLAVEGPGGVQASGRWVNHRDHGLQFKAEFLRTAPPTRSRTTPEASFATPATLVPTEPRFALGSPGRAPRTRAACAAHPSMIVSDVLAHFPAEDPIGVGDIAEQHGE